MSKQMYHLVDSDFKRIIRNIFWLNSDSKVDFIVDLYAQNKDKEDTYFYREFGYEVRNRFHANMYINLKYNLEFNTSYKTDNGNVKESVGFNINNIYQLHIALETAALWLTGKDYANLFVKHPDGTVRISQDVNPVIIRGMFQDTSLEFIPAVYNDYGQNLSGISLYINKANEPIFIDSMKFMNLKYCLSNFNMELAAMQMVNFLGRPSTGEFYYSDYLPEEYTRMQEQYSRPVQQQQQQRPRYQNKSFLSLVGATERKEEDEN